MIELGAFPPEIFSRIIEFLVVTIGVYKSVRYRLVNRVFDGAVLSAITNPKVIDIFDPMVPYLKWHIPPALTGRALLRRAQTPKAVVDEFPGLYAITSVNRALDNLTKPSEKERIKQHQLIAEEVARDHNINLILSSSMSPCGPDEQMVFCGAIILGDLPVVKDLLEEREPSTPSVHDWIPYYGRPLSLAAAWGHREIVRYLLGCGANPHIINSHDGTEKERLSGMNATVGRPLVYRNADGVPLRAAVLGGHDDIVHLLLQPENRITATKAEFFRTMGSAVKGGHMHLFQLLDSVLVEDTGKSWSAYRGVGESLLVEAARHGNENIVNMLLDNGVDINKQVGWAYSYPLSLGGGGAIHNAAMKGNTSMVRLLLDRGADEEENGSWGIGEPITIAAKRGHEEITELILERTARGNLKHYFYLAITAAVENGHVHLVKRLISQYPEFFDTRLGLEMLTNAIASRNLTMISVLVDAGVPLNHDDPEEMHPINAARDFAAQWVVDYLVSIGAEDRDWVGEANYGLNFGDDESRLVLRGCVLICRRTWEWQGKY